MKKTFSVTGLVVLCLIVAVSLYRPSPGYAAKSPSETISDYARKTVSTLKDTDLTQIENFEPLRQQLFEQLAPILDFRLMTRSALGPAARSITQEQLNELTNVFKPLVVRLYTDRLLEYLAVMEPPWVLDDIVVHGEEIRGGGSYAMVKTTAKVHRGDQKRDLAMNFKMYKQNGRWLVYDLVFEGVSMVENYRSQFSAVLANNSIEDLIEQLRAKLEKLRSKSVHERVGDTSESSSGN